MIILHSPAETYIFSFSFLQLFLGLLPCVADYYVIRAIIVLCCFSDDNAYLVYAVEDTAISGGEVRCCVSAKILAEI
jgi:hypothetical protein